MHYFRNQVLQSRAKLNPSRFMVRRVSDNKAVATGLNFDVYDEPTLVEASQGIEYVLEMLGICFEFKHFSTLKSYFLSLSSLTITSFL
jgi:hypothetical protein